MIIDNDSYLEHVGVKGMRWGIRRARNRSPGTTVSTTTYRDGKLKSHKVLNQDEQKKLLVKTSVIAATMLVGTLAVNRLLKDRNLGNVKISAQSNVITKGKEITKRISEVAMLSKMKTIRTTFNL